MIISTDQAKKIISDSIKDEKAEQRRRRRHNIIKLLGAHVAKHRTQDLKHIMFNSKPSWLGRIYRKILEPICYLVGRLWQ